MNYQTPKEVRVVLAQVEIEMKKIVKRLRKIYAFMKWLEEERIKAQIYCGRPFF